jgi:hypothetical protein
MMISRYANFVIQKMVVTAEKQQVGLLLDVARNNADNLKRYPHGRHVIAAMEKFLSEKGMVVYTWLGNVPCCRMLVMRFLPVRQQQANTDLSWLLLVFILLLHTQRGGLCFW